MNPGCKVLYFSNPCNMKEPLHLPGTGKEANCWLDRARQLVSIYTDSPAPGDAWPIPSRLQRGCKPSKQKGFLSCVGSCMPTPSCAMLTPTACSPFPSSSSSRGLPSCNPHLNPDSAQMKSRTTCPHPCNNKNNTWFSFSLSRAQRILVLRCQTMKVTRGRGMDWS